MARPSATAASLLLLLALVAVAHCHALGADHATDASAAESTVVVAVGDESGPTNPDLTVEADATEVVPAEQRGFLRLPSHRRHRNHPCRHGLVHGHLWWARHHDHGIFRRDAHRFRLHGLRSELDGGPKEAGTEEVKPVAEPDPDRSLPDSDGEGELTTAAVEPWKKEMLWRMVRHGLQHRYEEEEGADGMKRFQAHHHDDHEEDGEEPEKKMRKRIRRHGGHDEEEEEDEQLRKRFLHAEDGDSESADEDDEAEELVRRFRKAVMRRKRFHRHGRRFHHHRYRREEAGERADGEEGGVMAWIRGLMNRF